MRQNCRSFRCLINFYEVREAVSNPGVIFSEADAVIPDVVWVSRERLAVLIDEAGHLTGAPEAMVEVLSPGAENERCDRSKTQTLRDQRRTGILDCGLETPTNRSLPQTKRYSGIGRHSVCE